MLDFEKCRLPDGAFDHKKYDELRKQENAERKAKGELCQLPGCNRFIVYSQGHPQICSDCKALDKPEELDHPSDIRCPKCGHHWSVWETDDHELYAEGEHDVKCDRCNHEFMIVTEITYSFESPERIKETVQDEIPKEEGDNGD